MRYELGELVADAAEAMLAGVSAANAHERAVRPQLQLGPERVRHGRTGPESRGEFAKKNG